MRCLARIPTAHETPRALADLPQNPKSSDRVFCWHFPMEWVICSPCEYYSPRMKAFISEECRLPRNQWIYHIIQNNVKHTDERIFLTAPRGACVSTSTGAHARPASRRARAASQIPRFLPDWV